MATNNTTRETGEYPCWYRNRGAGPYEPCKYAGKSAAFGLSYVMVMIFIFAVSRLLHFFLRPYGFPRLFSQVIAAVFIGNVGLTEEILNIVIGNLLPSITDVGLGGYLLVLGLEMDLSILYQRPIPPEAKVAYICMFTTFLVSIIVTPMLRISLHDELPFYFSLALVLAGTSSPLLTRLVKDLKMGNSDIGRLIIGAGNYTDTIIMIFLAVARAFQHTHGAINTKKIVLVGSELGEGCFTIFLVFLVIIFLTKVLNMIVSWINERNPEGKPIRGSDLVILGGVMFILYIIVPALIGYSATMSCFLIGLAFPRKGRIPKMLIGRMNQVLNLLVFPLFFGWIGASANIRCLMGTSGNDKYIWMVKFVFLYIVVMIGKVSGVIFSGMFLGFNWTVAFAIGAFLNVKGYFQILLAVLSLEHEQISRGTYLALILFSILSMGVIPFLAKFIIKQAEDNKSPIRAVQWVDPSTELRMLLCIHGLLNIPTMINIMEVSRGNTDHTISAYVTDMIEINDCNTIPDHHQEFHYNISNDNGDAGSDTATIADESVVNMREEISKAILSYVERSGEGIKVHRLLAISTYANMHQDLLNLAEAVEACLIILPYHKSQRKDGKMDNSHHGFRHVNRKVLRQAQCSIGILVDRGLGVSPITTIQVAVIFIGGKDDREALAYSTRIAQHPAIKLTAVRFVLDTNHEKSSNKSTKPKSIRLIEEQELKLDDEYIAEFYEKKVAHGKVEYIEKHVINAKEMVSTLKSYESQYSLFIVGRSDKVNRILTAGMSNWEESPDLGPLGDILADSDFSIRASVLVIQQYAPHELENEFSVMRI